MDDGKGHFEPISEKKYKEQEKLEESHVFKEGEIFRIKGSLFRLHRILGKKMVLKLLKRIPKNPKNSNQLKIKL